MDNESKKLTSNNHKKEIAPIYSIDDAIKELDELKNLALSCVDKNGNPNISAALRAIESKAKLAGLYKQNNSQMTNYVQMNEIVIDGKTLNLNVGEDLNDEI